MAATTRVSTAVTYRLLGDLRLGEGEGVGVDDGARLFCARGARFDGVVVVFPRFCVCASVLLSLCRLQARARASPLSFAPATTVSCDRHMYKQPTEA